MTLLALLTRAQTSCSARSPLDTCSIRGDIEVIDFYSTTAGDSAALDPGEIAFACFSRIALSTHHLTLAGEALAGPRVFTPLATQPLDSEHPFAYEMLVHGKKNDTGGWPRFQTVVRLDRRTTLQVLRLWMRLERLATARGALGAMWHLGCYLCRR
jgi:hypothetical protein